MRVCLLVLGSAFLSAAACSPRYTGSAVLSATATEARAEADTSSSIPIACRHFEFIDQGSARAVTLWLENKTGYPIRKSFDLAKVRLVKAGKREPAVAVAWEVHKKADDGTFAPGTAVARVSDCELEVPKKGARMTVYFNGDPAGGEVQFYDLRAKVGSPTQ